MVVGFTENEKKHIREKLHAAAEQCLSTFGVRKTTVEQLTKMAGISKGAFYIFYSSKEILFFEVLEAFQSKIGEQLIASLSQGSCSKRQLFTDTVFELYTSIQKSFMLNIMQTNEIEYLMRKLPPEVLTEHHSFDDLLTVKLFEALKIEAEQKVEVVSAALRAIFMTMLHQEEIGSHYDEALKLLITGVAKQIIEEV